MGGLPTRTFCTTLTKEERTKSSSNSELEEHNNLIPIKSKDPFYSNRDQTTIPLYFNAIQEPSNITPIKCNEPSSNDQTQKIIPSYLNASIQEHGNVTPIKSKDPSYSNRDQKTISSYFNAIQEPTHITPRKSIPPSSIVQAEKTTLSNFTATIQEPRNIIPLSNTQRRPINLENVLETEAVIHKKRSTTSEYRLLPLGLCERLVSFQACPECKALASLTYQEGLAKKTHTLDCSL